MKTLCLDSAELSHVGKKRKNNEDDCLNLPQQGVFCVADGMGGVVGGDLASEAITSNLRTVVGEGAHEQDQSLLTRVDRVERGINQASKWIKQFADEKGFGQMGSTVVALIFSPETPGRATALHAGDSRLYRYRRGELRLLTTDHTAEAAISAKLGHVPDSLPAKYQNELTRAVGLQETIELDRTDIEVLRTDIFLLCSDGLTKMMDDALIARLIGLGSNQPLESVAKHLVDAANEAGGRDNVTVVLVKAGDSGDQISGRPEAKIFSPEATDDYDAAVTRIRDRRVDLSSEETKHPPQSDTVVEVPKPIPPAPQVDADLLTKGASVSAKQADAKPSDELKDGNATQRVPLQGPPAGLAPGKARGDATGEEAGRHSTLPKGAPTISTPSRSVKMERETQAPAPACANDSSSLEARSGQALASAGEKERTVARRKRLLKWSATAVGLTVILGGMLVGGPKAWQSYRRSQAAGYVERAKSLERESDWDRAIESYRKAAEWGAPVEPKVEELAKKLTERQASYVLALDNARQAQKEAEAAVGQKDYTKATADLNRALAKVREAQAKKVTPEAAQLEKDLRGRQESVEGLARDAMATERAYASAMKEARAAQAKAVKALEAKNYPDTLKELETALSKVGEATAKKETREATKLKSDLEDTRRTLNAAIAAERAYSLAMDEARTAQAKALKALEAKNYPDTLGELDTALSKVGEAIAKQVTSDATKLKSDLEDTRRTVNAAIAVNKAYDSAMEEARTAQAKALKALEAKNYPDTLKELDSSLSKVGEATAKKETREATKLKGDLEDTKRTVNEAIAVNRAYDSAMEEARTAQANAVKALEAKNYPDTLKELETALSKVDEATAKKETSDAKKLKSGLEAMVRTAKEADATAKKDQEAYSAAMTDARKAQQEAEVAAKQKNYTKAAEDLKRALTKVQEAQTKNPTSEATQLENQLEERQLVLPRAAKERDTSGDKSNPIPSEDQAGEFHRMEVDFESLLVEVQCITSPNYLTTKEASSQQPIYAYPDELGKKPYYKRIKTLEQYYQQHGLLDDNRQRRKYLKQVKDRIDSW